MEAIIAKSGLSQAFQWLVLGEPAPITYCTLDGYIRDKQGRAFDLIETNFLITDPLNAIFEVVLTEDELERVFGSDTVSPQTGTLEIWGTVPGLKRMLIAKRPVECH